MPEKADVDADSMELIERRLSEKIEVNLRGRLFKSYLGIGSAVIAVLGFFGWNLVSDLKSSLSDRFEAKIVRPYTALLDDIKNKLAQADAVQDGTNRSLLRIENTVAEVQPRLAALSSFADQMKDLDTKVKDLQGTLASIQSSTATVADISQRASDLADQLQKLAASINTTRPTEAVREIASESGSIRDSLAESAKSISAPTVSNTVFFQYSQMPPETAEQIRNGLMEAGFLVPGVDEEAMPDGGLGQVRYYYDADRPAAAVLSDQADRVIQGLGLNAPAVQVTSYTDWARRKPQPGTLELWVGLPTAVEPQMQTGFKVTPGERRVDQIIISDTQQDNFEAEMAALVQHNVSYHYLIKSDGEVVTLVDENNVAYHSGVANAVSIGIGLMHVSGNDYTDEQVKALAELLKDIVGRRKIPASGIIAKSEVDTTKPSDFLSIKAKVLALVFPADESAPAAGNPPPP